MGRAKLTGFGRHRKERLAGPPLTGSAGGDIVLRSLSLPTIFSTADEEPCVPTIASEPLILVVEDSRLGRKVAEALLSRLGYHVELAASGSQALERLASRAFDAVLMDCQMPEMDGFELTARIRKTEAGSSRTPIVAVTANDAEGDRERCLAAGMDDYLVKPLSAGSLDITLRRLLGGQPEGLPVAARPAVSTPEPAALDLGVLASLRGYRDAGLLKDLAGLFLRSVPGRLAGLRAACADGDRDEVAKLAHALKGNSGNVGALEMARLCSRLETACRDDPESLGGLIQKLEAESERVTAALRGLLLESEPTEP
jgi:two-component system, sensor histidine kinase and response regulator